jgi:peptidoglycan/LPS O-acetylase OafA/YrhL
MSSSKSHILKIDLIKGLAILAVVLTHSLPYDGNFMTLRMLSISMALPIFILLMGRNMAASFKKHQYLKSNGIISSKYFKNRLKRFLYPFIPIFMLSIMLGIIFNRDIYLGILNLVGYLPLPGPGNYFITVLLQFVLIFPLLYFSYQRHPRLTLLFAFLISFVFELFSSNLNAFNSDSYLYYANILRYLFLITLGLWVFEGFEPKKRIRSSRESYLVMVGLAISILYLMAFSVFHWEFPFFNNFWGTEYPTLGSYVFLMAFYPLAIYMLAYRILPSNSHNKLVRSIQYLGKASYHIFLVQILFFAVLYNPYSIILRHELFGINHEFIVGLFAIIISLGVTIPAGVLFYKYEDKLIKLIDMVYDFNKNLIDIRRSK